MTVRAEARPGQATEDLLCKQLPERYDVDRWYHDLYTPLVLAIYEEDKAQASKLLQPYCDAWYPAFEQAPWHDTHLLREMFSRATRNMQRLWSRALGWTAPSSGKLQ